MSTVNNNSTYKDLNGNGRTEDWEKSIQKGLKEEWSIDFSKKENPQMSFDKFLLTFDANEDGKVTKAEINQKIEKTEGGKYTQQDIDDIQYAMFTYGDEPVEPEPVLVTTPGNCTNCEQNDRLSDDGQ